MEENKKSGWGGKREGSGSGGVRPGAGRKPEIAKLRKGAFLVMERQAIGGEIQKPQLWKIISIGGGDETIIEFQCGNDIVTLRKPNDE